MKDIHNHLLYGIDDGSDSLDKSISILKQMECCGVTDIVLTPHYIIGTNYNKGNDFKLERLNELQRYTSIKLYLGNEVFIDNNIIKYIKNNEISSINGSRYVLIELPLNEYLMSMNDIIFDLRNNGYIPIIAHPERYHYMNLDDLINLINQGCLLQGNITSLIGKYGNNSKDNLILLLKKHMIHFLGTDTHGSLANIDICLNKLSRIVSSEMKDDLLCLNFDKVINNKEIIPYNIIEVKSLFKKEMIK